MVSVSDVHGRRRVTLFYSNRAPAAALDTKATRQCLLDRLSLINRRISNPSHTTQ